MSAMTSIEWTDATWNPLRGCSRVSDGCRNCYAEKVAMRFRGEGQPYEGLVRMTTQGPKWTGEIKLVPAALREPFGWAKPRRVFVNSMSDLFHESVPFEFIASVFAVMSVTTRHTYQVLTKRPARMLEFFQWVKDGAGCFDDDAISSRLPKDIPWVPHHHNTRRGGYDNCGPGFPYENVWLGVSVENQATADERIPLLLQCPAAVRWISAEPLLGPVDLERVLWPDLGDHRVDVLRGGYWNEAPYLLGARSAALGAPKGGFTNHSDMPGKLDWVVVGGESGNGARPMNPWWARSLRDQCDAAGVKFLFKQWGEWAEQTPEQQRQLAGSVIMKHLSAWPDGTLGHGDFRENGGYGRPLFPVGKKAAGRLLDGRTHDEFPEAR
ncbi:hypothetical protein PPGU19_011500 [Paraburkholderia sp. PGU19]|uniref:DUF5131 family protein n=1 Tax=Paraburkholderia sp. PGU19 TaxID=2735434 RepID=UPI0015D9D839|nr:phage Gp37/Gp68 family protein [Paraburkholderia sp. PGU19]BCF96581.1 hypothetical protein PPGU19_011500 [Paraburkholderia sp. PGU19]